MQFIRANVLPLLVILVGFCASLALALAPFNFLLANIIPDDSFYYFQIARNIAHGLGSTFDGVNLTNGYHPLWLLILLPIYHFFSTGAVLDIAPIHAALVIGALFNGALGLVLLRIFTRYTRSAWIMALALAAWYFNPFNLYEMSDGLETALSVFCIALFVLTALRFNEDRTRGRLAVVATVGGLMMLARLDNLFYFVMFLAWLLYDGGWRASIQNVLFVGVIASIVVSPWLIFNYLAFGMFFTSASLAYTIVNHQIILEDHGPSMFQQIKAVIFMTDYSLRQFIAPRTGAPSVFFTLFGLTIGWLIFTEGRLRALVRSIPLEAFLGGGVVLIFIVNASIRWSPREWYFVAFNLFLVVWLAWLLEKLRESGKLRPSAVAVIVCLILSLYYISWSKNLHNVNETGLYVLTTTLWMNDNLPTHAIIGAFNSGIEGYFSTHRLINLDGLVNNRAYEAIMHKDEWEYIQSEHIGYIADFGQRFTYRMRGLLGIDNVLGQLEVVHETYGGPTVYKVR